MSRLIMQRKDKPKPPPSALKPRWQARIDDHPIGLAWSPDGKKLAVAGVSGPITLYNSENGAMHHTLAGHTLDTMAITWHKDSQVLASVGQDGQIRLWNAETGVQTAALDGGASWVERVAFSPTADWLVSAAGRKLRLWHINGELLREYPDANSTITDIKWRPDGQAFAISAYNGVVLYDPTHAEPLRRFVWQGSTLTLAWSPDAKYIATGDQDSTVHFWITHTGKDLQMWGYETKVLELSWSADNRYLATGGGSRIVVWDCSGAGPAGTKPLLLAAHQQFVKHLQFQRRGLLLASGGTDGLLTLWRIAGKKGTVQAQQQCAADIAGIAWSPDDRMLVVADSQGAIQVLPVALG
jgi:WD40 repeat protein